MRNLVFVLLFLFSFQANSALNNVDKQLFLGPNLMDNGGFENGRAGWTASGGSFIASNSSPLAGALSGSWNSDGAGQTVSFKSTAIPEGLKSSNGVFMCKVQTPSGTATHNIEITNGSDVLATQAITSSTSAVWQILNFVFPSSGSVVPRLQSVASDEPTIKIDDCWLGDANLVNLTEASRGAELVGQSYFATTASCVWTRNNTAMGAFGTNSNCPGPTVIAGYVGNWQTTDADLPQQTINNLPPGRYEVEFGSYVDSSGAGTACLAVSDGSTTGPNSCAFTTSGNEQYYIIAKAIFDYTSAGNRTFQAHGAISANTLQLDNAGNLKQASFLVKRFPGVAEQAFKADTLAMSWSGYHDNTCSWAITSTSYANPSGDASCALVQRTNMNFGTVTSALSSGNPLPGIVFTPKRAGTYYVCAHSAFTSNNINTAQRLWDGTTTIAESPGPGTNSTANNFFALCGLYEVSDTSARTLTIQGQSNSGTITIQAPRANSAIEWTIFAIDQAFPQPLVKQSVVTGFDGQMRIETAKINCDSGSSIISQSSTWITAVTNISAGSCTMTIANGVFSSAPSCFFNSWTDDGAGDPPILGGGGTAPTTTSVKVDASGNSGGDATAFDFDMMCIGPR